MKLHLLGVNGPYPASGGATSGYLLETGDSLFQFDLGSGVLSRLTALMPPEELTALFLTHWHFDHAADLPVLMYRLQALNTVLPVYAPVDETSALRKIVRDAGCFDLTDVAPGDTLTLGNTQILVGNARHPVPAVGYRIIQDGKSLGYTGDTNTLPGLADFYRGCNLLLADGLFPRENWSESVPHLSAELAARLAAEANVSSLIITHLNPAFSPRLLLEEARSVFPSVRIAETGTTVTL